MTRLRRRTDRNTAGPDGAAIDARRAEPVTERAEKGEQARAEPRIAHAPRASPASTAVPAPASTAAPAPAPRAVSASVAAVAAERAAAREEFDACYAARAKQLTAAVYAMTGDVTEAEDAVQEAFARAWQRWDRLTAHGEDPTPWIRTVATRLAVSSWRKSRNRVRAHFRHGPPADLPGLGPDHVALVDALRRLRPDQRRAVVLHYVLDLPIAAVAEQTGATPGAVKTRLRRARTALGTHLREREETAGPARGRGA
ncbi:SigE family RNA polymerase sigma factor [Streptomyces sp. NPDC004726]